VKNYYNILEVSNQASQEQIKKSYRRLALKYHPDKSTYGGAKDLFTQLNEAYNVLGKKESRALYDLQLRQQSPPIHPRNNSTRNPYARKKPSYKRTPKTPKIDIAHYLYYFRRISIATFAFCLLIGLDYFLPPIVSPEQITSIEIDRSRREYRLKLNTAHFGVNGPEIVKLSEGHDVELSYTPIFKKLLKLTIVIEEKVYDYYVQVSIYRSFSFSLYVLLLTSYLGVFHFKNPETIMNLAIVNCILSILVIAFLAVS